MRSGTSGTLAFRNRGTLRAAVPLAVVLSGTLLSLSSAGVSQTAGVNQGGPGYVHSPAGMDALSQPNPTNPAKLEQMREEDRHKRLVADTTKLISLSNELKEDIDKASKDQLSLDVVKKAAEIEKLAHDVKERMKS